VKAVSKRILVWSTAGAATGLTHALFTRPNAYTVLTSIFIGITAAIVAGSIASIPMEKITQTILTGAAAGLCVGLLSSWLLGSSQRFGAQIVGFVAGVATFRFVNSFSRRTLDSDLWAQRKCVHPQPVRQARQSWSNFAIRRANRPKPPNGMETGSALS
jgi:membrane associated rhomboid family serine protease